MAGEVPETSPEKKISSGLRMSPTPLEHIRWENEQDPATSQALVDYIGLPVTGEALLHSIRELTDVSGYLEKSGNENLSVEKAVSNLIQIIRVSQNDVRTTTINLYKNWTILLGYIRTSGFTLAQIEQEFQKKNPDFSIKKIILGILWAGAQKEAALQKIDKLEGSYHLAKNHALMAMIASEVTQEYAEEFFEEGRWDIVKKTFALPEKGLDIAKTKAGQLVEKAKPSLRKYLSTMTPEKQEKLFGRMVKFLSEDDVGKRLVAMSEAMPGAAVTKGLTGSLKSTVSGVKEGIFSPLCACMMSVMLDGAEDKEKTMIQYVTFLVAGQLVQEGGKWVAKGGLLPLIEPMLKKIPDASKAGKILDFLKKGSPNKFAVLAASVTLVIAAFQIPMVTDMIADVANSIDENWDHGTGREVVIGGVSAASYLMQFSSKRFVPVAVALEAGQIALDGANPFKDQDEFLFKFITGDADNLIQTGEQLVGRNPIAAWNSRVDSAKKGENTTQKSIIDQSKLQDGNDWALRTIVPFRQELNEFENHETQLKLLLSQLKVSPISSTPLSVSVDAQNLRYRDYALAGDDVWHTRDGLGTESLQGSFWEPQKRGFMQVPWTGGFDPRNIADSVSAVSRGMGWGNLSGRNDKALAWLDDIAGSPENRLDEFFEHECDALIAAEKAKCQRLKYSSPSIGTSYPGYTPPQYEFDAEAYKKIEPWVKQLEAARNEWKAMRTTADALAKKVVIARGLGIYDAARWTAPGSEGNPLIEPGENESPTMAFQGMMNEIVRRSEIIDLTTPTDASKASAILDAAGSGLRMYGDDIIDGEWRERNDDEYTKWVEKNGFGIDDRHIHTDRLKQLIREVYKAGIPVEYIEMSLKSVSSVARNQSEGKYVTPDMVREIEGKLGNYLLDKAFRDDVKRGVNIDTLHRVEYACPGYNFIRTYTPEKNDTGTVFRVEDRIKTTSYRAVPGGGASQVMTSERTIGSKSIAKESLLRNIQLTQVQIVREEKIQAEKDQIAQAQIREKALFRQQKDIHKGDNEANFREYYSSSELSQKSWTEVSEKGIPVVFAHLRGGSSMSAVPESGWGWKQPDFHNAIVISAYFGPGDIREVTLGRLDALKSLDNNLQKACKIALSSGKLTDPLRSIINMCDGSILYGSSGRVKQNYVSDLYQEIIPDFEKASDKKAFLTKTLDELLKYNGISGENFDTIVSNITGK